MDIKDKKFTIIRHRGQLNEGILPDGTKVYRKDKLYVLEWGAFVPCAPYDEHFIYETPSQYKMSAYLCTCGSFACIAGLSGYVMDASPQGKMFICFFHSIYGYHADGSKWI